MEDETNVSLVEGTPTDLPPHGRYDESEDNGSRSAYPHTVDGRQGTLSIDAIPIPRLPVPPLPVFFVNEQRSLHHQPSFAVPYMSQCTRPQQTNESIDLTFCNSIMPK